MTFSPRTWCCCETKPRTQLSALRDAADGAVVAEIAAHAPQLGLGGGLSLFTQDFDTRGNAPNKKGLIPFVALGGSALLDLWLPPDSISPAKRSPQFALRVSLGADYHF